jgi:hypothetical protein
MESEWQKICHSIKDTAKKILGYKTKRNHKGWYDEVCNIALDIHNEKRTRMLQRTTRTTIEDYRIARREAHKICCKKRKEYEEEIIQTMQTYSVRSERRKFYQGVRKFKECYQTRTTVCRDKEGNMVGGEREVMNR